MAEMMNAVVCHGPRDYRLERVPVPLAGSGEALLRVEAVGICASDLKCHDGAAKFWGDDSRPAWAESNVVPGHEIAGRIVSGDGSALAGWGVRCDDRVVVEQILPCDRCRYCREGSYHMCQVHTMYGFKRAAPGGMAEYMVIREGSRVHRVSPDIPPAHAAFAEPLSCALHAVERGEVTMRDVVVVAGCGPVGLGMVAGAAAKSPAQVIALDRDPARLSLAQQAGATVTVDISQQDPLEVVLSLTGGYGADVYLEGTGHPAAVQQGLDLLCKMGRFVEYSVFKEPTSVDWSIISDDKALDIRGAHLGPYLWPAAIRMIEEGRLPLESICTHQLPLTDFADGLELVRAGDKSIKVSLLP